MKRLVSDSVQTTPRHNSIAEGRNTDIAASLLEAAAQASNEQESSAESGDDLGEGSPNATDKPEKRKKRSRACQACRTMKIRCNPVEGQQACLACSKVNRECVMPGPARKRQKTVHKVAELEKKINALTQSLIAKTQTNPTPQQSPVVNPTAQRPSVAAGNGPTESTDFPLFPKSEASQIMPSMCYIKPGDKGGETHYEDVIDRGIISFAMADRVFNKFVNDLNPHCPLIAFPPGTTAESVRRTRPMLFLAILAGACLTIVPETHVELTQELAQQLAQRAFFIFERSLDLIQALLLQTTWVGKHQGSKEMGFNQYIHSAIVMAHDMGLSKRLKTPLTKDPVEEAENRRSWLACYWAGTCVASTLRHPSMINYSPYIDECLEFFANSPAALPTDTTLCAMVKMVAIMEDVAKSFHMADPASTVRIQDASTQYSLKIFEKRIDDWRKEHRTHLEPGLFNIINATCTLFTHEIALHTDHNIDDFRPPTGLPGQREMQLTEDFITPSHLDAITKCVVAMKQALETFINFLPSQSLQHLPSLMIVWTAYCVVAMIRLDGALRATNSKYAEIFLPDLKVEYYLDCIIARLTAGLGPTPPYSPLPMFVQGFQKLKMWHQYRLAGAMPKELRPIDDSKTGLDDINNTIDKFVHGGSRGTSDSPATFGMTAPTPGGVENGMIGMNPAQTQKMKQLREQQRQGQNNGYFGTNQQGFDTQGGSWLTNSNIPIDASMFENQDWNFSLEDWNNFEASMVQPAGGSWLGYLL